MPGIARFTYNDAYYHVMTRGNNKQNVFLEYFEFLRERIVKGERRSEERFFREEAYGSQEFILKLQKSGLASKWSHKGRPKKKKIEK